MLAVAATNPLLLGPEPFAAPVNAEIYELPMLPPTALPLVLLAEVGN